MTILLTGATGTAGSAPAAELGAAGADVRALVRSAAGAERLERLGVTAVAGSFEDLASLRRALDGADALFLLSPAGDAGMVAEQVRVVDAAVAAGVRRVVKLSSIDADEDAEARIVRAHREIERRIEASGLAWTHLRPH